MTKDKIISFYIPRRYLTIACICLIALAGIQCSRDGDNDIADRSKVTVLWPGNELILSPAWDDNPKFLVFSSLVTRDSTGHLRPHLAESWEHSEDYSEWTIHIRKDVKWHDGISVTAHDLKFSFEIRSHPDILYFSPDYIESMTVIDDFSLKIKFNKPCDPRDWWEVYYPEHILKDLDPKEMNSWEFWTHPVGNGAYCFIRHVPKTMMEFEANPDYFLGKPKIERVILKLTGGTALTELLSGNVDIAQVGSMNLKAVAKDPRFQVYYQWGPRRTQIFWNHNHSLFRLSSVRRALTMAIDRRLLHMVLDYPDDLPLTDGFFTQDQFWKGEYGEALPYDPDAAGILLNEVGWKDRDGDGVRELGSQSFKFTLLVLPGSLLKSAIFIQDQLRNIGVRMEVQSMASSLVRQRVLTGKFQAAIHKLGFPRKEFFGEKSPIGFDNTRVKVLFDALGPALDSNKRDMICLELSELFLEELPVTYLYPQISSYAVHRRIRGINSPHQVFPTRFMEHFWIEEEE